jgi:2-succinyl-5-enolpyruvyl-6-hydroxy-3-cyclohexene-1-carboxylate synthase
MERNRKEVSTVFMSKLTVLDHNLSRLWAQSIIGALLRQGVRSFYLSPGMRNAPLIAAVRHFQGQLPDVFVDSGFDERAQSFRALGRIRASERPAVVICTSGSALAHYAPAVVEADKSKLPLIVISSDRPVELVAANANQTTDQLHFFGKATRYSTSLEAPSPLMPPEAIFSLVTELFNQSCGNNPGPVHLNAPFREPLDGECDHSSWPVDLPRKLYAQKIQDELNRSPLQLFSSQALTLNQTPSLTIKSPLLIVIGELTKNAHRARARQLLAGLRKHNIPFLVDVASGIKYSFNYADGALPSPDHPEVFRALKEWPPATLIHIGGRTTAKHYYRLQREWSHTELITVNEDGLLHDPAHRRSASLTMPLEHGIAIIEKNLEGLYQEAMNLKLTDFIERKTQFINEAALAYPSLSKGIVETAPNDSTFMLGNSTVIRSFDSYASVQEKREHQVFVQRGASGIEGLLSEAMGLSDELHKLVVCVLGDIALLHDLNSLVPLQTLHRPMVVVVVNNGGGGIFHLLPAGNDPLIEKDLFTPHQVSFHKLALALNLESYVITEAAQFRSEFPKLCDRAKTQSKPILIEAIINDSTNTEIYRELKTIKL